MLFQRKNKSLLAVADGMINPLSAVPDEAFASEILGKGFAVEPSAGTVYSPVSGTVENVAETRHAYNILSDDGLDILVHIGVDTVQMNGEGFLSMVKCGDRVKAGDVLCRADIQKIREQGYPTIISVVVTSSEKLKSIEILMESAIGGKTESMCYQLL